MACVEKVFISVPKNTRTLTCFSLNRNFHPSLNQNNIRHYSEPTFL